ncbi:MAG TPA: replicative DNA helicase [Acidobacteriota bacterium]|nr:replicative DNA helicase [Acidobacteriota bacterium]
MEGSPRRAFKPKWSPSAVAEENGGSDTGRVPPHSDDAEKAVLGSMLASPDAVTGAIEILATDAFYDPRHAKIWRAMTELFERSAPIDLVTVAEELKRRNDFEAVGGYSYLTSLDQYVTHAGNVESHAKIVQEKQTLRRMIDVSRSIVDAAYEQKEEARVLLDSAEQRVFEIANDQMRSGFVPMNKLVLQGFSAIEEYRQRKVHVTGTPTGYYDLDEMTAGFQKSDFVVIAGRPSMGKTSFALNIAENVAVRTKPKDRRPVGVFSLEMSKDALVQRMLCSLARVDIHKIRRGYASADEYRRLQNSAAQLHEAPLWIDDTAAITILEMRAKSRRLASAEGPLGMIIVDYLQLVRGPESAENRQQEISTISRSLKALAKELETPVVALSQLSRAVETRGGAKRPMLSDLRESGAIEQDADVVLFVYRPEVYETEPEKKDGKAEIIIAKQRNGPIGTVDLAFLSECTRFESLRELPPAAPPPGLPPR